MRSACIQLMLVLVFCGLAIASNGLAQEVLNRPVSIQAKGEKLQSILHKLETASGVKFTYVPRVVHTADPVTIRAVKEPLENVLNRLLAPREISYSVNGNYIVLKKDVEKSGSSALQTSQVAGQNVDISLGGTVRDEQGMPLPGVSIVLKGTQRGTTTNAQGEFTLNVPDNSAVLIFSYVGYVSQELEVGSRSRVDVTMKIDNKSLEEVVVVGYGTQKKSNLTGAVGTVKGEELIGIPVTQASQALQGRLAGVTVTQNLGAPGSNGATIRIRGVGTLGNSNPLVLIDGVEGNLNDVDPAMIETISVLKDAASSAIYGSRAANGVVLITTRRGNKGQKIATSFRTITGIETPTNVPELVNGPQYIELTNESRMNENKVPVFSDSFIKEYLQNRGTEQHPETDWYKVAMKPSALQQQYNLSLSGGTERLSVFGSLSYTDQGGLIENVNFKRLSVRVNTDYQISKTLSANTDIFLTQGKQRTPSDGVNNLFRMMSEVPPLYNAQYADGSWGEGWNGSNPLARARAGGKQDMEQNRVQLIFKMNFDPTPSIHFETFYAPKFLNTYTTRFVKQSTFHRPGGPEETIPARNQMNQSYGKTVENNFRYLGSFQKTLNRHSFKILGGIDYTENRNEYFNAYRENFAIQDYEVLDAGSQENRNNGGSASEWALLSYYSRLNYEFNDRYLLEANFRYDGSSRFATGKKYGFFPSFSAGWRISQEAFLKGSPFLTDLKLRASWGRLGNQEIGNYPFASVVNLSGLNYSFNKSPVNGAALTDLANPDIVWETTGMLNVGIDYGFFGNRLSGTLEFYDKFTRDILLKLPVPLVIGMNPSYKNAGVVRNTGWEAAINYRNRLKELRYTVGFLFSDVRNRVMDLKGTGPYNDDFERTTIREGQEINSFYGYASAGLFQSQEEIKASPTQFGNVKPGDIRYLDQNGDNVINSEDRVIMGSTLPRYTYSFNLTLNYANWDLAVFFQGVGKRDGIVLKRGNNINYAGTYQTWELDRWTPENTGASLPRTTFVEPNNIMASDFYMKSAAYTRLKNIQLGYTLPHAFLKAASLAGLRIYFSGQNLLTLTRYFQGFDPEAPSGAGMFFYPNTKVWSVGIDIKF